MRESHAATTDQMSEEIPNLVERKTQPGIVVLNESGHLIYQNQTALAIMASRALKDPSNNAPERPSFPHLMLELYAEFKRSSRPTKEQADEAPLIENRVLWQGAMRYVLRSLPLQPQRDQSSPAHLLILIEPVFQSPRIEYWEQSIRLTPREKRVVQLLLEGKTNKEVAVCMRIGEYTVKDHIKQIMKKLNVNTRAGIVSKIYLLNAVVGGPQKNPSNLI